MRIWGAIGLLSCLILAACARHARPAVSYVSSKISPTEIAFVVADATAHLARALPPAQTTLQLAPTKSRAGGEMSDALAEYLRATGYGVLEADMRDRGEDAMSRAVPLRYLVSRLDDGIVLHLQYQGLEASCFYPRTADGNLVRAAPFSVRRVP